MTVNPWAPPPTPSGSGAPRLSEPLSADPQVRWGIPDALVTLALTMALAVGGSLAVRAWGLPVTGTLIILVGAVVPWLGLLGWPLWATWRKGRGPMIDLDLRLDAVRVRAGLGYGLLGLLLAGLTGAITMIVRGEPLSSAAGEVAQQLAGQPGALLLLIVVAVIGAPIVEEIAFRGLLQRSLLKRGIPAWVAIGISALAFATFHLEWERVNVLFVVGVVMGVVARRHGTGAAIIAHAVNNAVASLGILTLISQ